MGLIDLIKNLPQIVKESKQDWDDMVGPVFSEFGELITDGVKEMAIKGNSDYMTSYEKIQAADSLVEESQEELEKIAQELKNYYKGTDKMVKEHFQFKQSLQEGLEKEFAIVTNRSTSLQHELASLEMSKGKPVTFSPGVALVAGSVAGGLALTGITTFARLNPILLGVSTITWVHAKNKRVKAATQYLNDAKEYAAKVEVKIQELKATKSRLRVIRKTIKEERGILDRLITRMSELRVSLESLDGKPVLSEDEKKKARGYMEIAHMLHENIMTKFFGSDGEITSEYEVVLNRLKELERAMDERTV